MLKQFEHVEFFNASELFYNTVNSYSYAVACVVEMHYR